MDRRGQERLAEEDQSEAKERARRLPGGRGGAGRVCVCVSVLCRYSKLRGQSFLRNDGDAGGCEGRSERPPGADDIRVRGLGFDLGEPVSRWASGDLSAGACQNPY